MKSLIGLIFIFPAFIIDLFLWIFGGWTKGGLLDMPTGNWVWEKFLRI